MSDMPTDDVLEGRVRDAVGREIDKARTPEFMERIRTRVVQDAHILDALQFGATCWLDADGRHIWFAHACNGEWVETQLVYGRPIGTKGNGGGWCAMQTNPLTVAPSVHCDGCGFHWNFTNGRFGG